MRIGIEVRGSSLLLLALSPLAFGVLSPIKVRATEVKCLGKVILHEGKNVGQKISKPLVDLGELATYDAQAGQDKECSDKVSSAAEKNKNLNNKTWLCQQIKEAGKHKVTAYAAVGTLDYLAAWSIDVTCTAGAKTCACPEGWAPNSSDSTAVSAAPNSCKRLAAQPITGTPLPPNGTQLGTWGFSWGNALYQVGNAKCATTPWVGN